MQRERILQKVVQGDQLRTALAGGWLPPRAHRAAVLWSLQHLAPIDNPVAGADLIAVEAEAAGARGAASQVAVALAPEALPGMLGTCQQTLLQLFCRRYLKIINTLTLVHEKVPSSAQHHAAITSC